MEICGWEIACEQMRYFVLSPLVYLLSILQYQKEKHTEGKLSFSLSR